MRTFAFKTLAQFAYYNFHKKISDRDTFVIGIFIELFKKCV